MPKRTRQRPLESFTEIKKFASIREIDRNVSTFEKRIQEIEALRTDHVSYSSQRVANVESSIRNSILDVFGPRSPELGEYKEYRLFYPELAFTTSRAMAERLNSENQMRFLSELPESITMLRGLINRLEEKRSDLAGATIQLDNAQDHLNSEPDKPPRAFLSYSHDSREHRAWIRDFAARLRSDGVETVLDQWELVPGDQVAQFMEGAVRANDFVLIVCTPRYKERSDARLGGVGYEGDIMSAEVFRDRSHRKFIPILRADDWSEAAPSWLAGKLHVDLRSEPYSEENYQELLTSLLGTRPKAPPVRTSVSPREPADSTGRQRTEKESQKPAELPSSGDLTDFSLPGARPQDFFPGGAMPLEAQLPGSVPGSTSLSIEHSADPAVAGSPQSDQTTTRVRATRKSRSLDPVQSVSGHNNVVAGRDVNINKREVTRLSVTPGPEHITEEQAKRLKDLLDKAAKIEIAAGSDPRKTYAKWWSELTNRYQVTSYRLIPRALGDEAIKWLQQRAAMLRPKLRRSNPSAWRREHYTTIWARARELGMSKGEVYSLVKHRLNVQVVSLKQLGEHNLRHLYNIMMSLDGKPNQ